LEPVCIRIAAHWPDVFAFFFLLSIAVAVVTVYLFGQKRGADPVRWNFYQLVAVGIGLLTSKLYMLRDGELASVLGGGGLPHATGMNLLGGVLGGALAVWLLRRAHRSRDPIFDAWAWLVPLAVIVGRIGCFSGGCCHGVPTSVPWATTYPAPALPVLHQWADGLLPATQGISLAVHPVPVYESLLLLLLLLVVRRVAPRLHRSSLFLVTVGGYSLIRFAMELVRYGGGTLGPLKTVQWGLLLVAAGCGLWLWHRERGVVAIPDEAPRPARLAEVALLALVVAASFWFDALERASLLVGAAPWAGHAAQRLGRRLGRRFGIRAPAVLSSGVALTLLAAWNPLFRKDFREMVEEDSIRLSGGWGGGEYKYVDESGCQDPPIPYTERFATAHGRAVFRHQYKEGEFFDLGLEYTMLEMKRVEGPEEGSGDPTFFGPNVIQAATAPYSLWAVGPVGLWDFYWGAMGLGVQTVHSSELDRSWGGVSVYLRGGPSDLLFAEAVLGATDQPSMGNGIMRYGVGVTLGPVGHLTVGATALGAFFVEPHIELDIDRVRLELMPLVNYWPDGDFFYIGGAAALQLRVSP
jgi:phosphatidylglycerol:prolipoprotein diacylglycerol transferase